MADVNKEIALKVTTDLGQTNQQFKNANAELKQTQKALVDMALAGKQGTAEFAAMEKRAGQLRDAIGDVRARVQTLASDTPKLEVLTSAMTGIAGGFAAAQGAAALFAGENEQVQQAILKTQGAMALLNGVQQVANTLNKDSAAMMALNSTATKAYGLAVGTSTGALKLFRLALIATGIGAAVVAIGALVANWDKLTAAVMNFVNNSPMLTKVIEFITDKFVKLGQALKFLPTAAQKSLEVQIEVFEKQKKLLEAQGKDTLQIERVILERKIELAKQYNKDYKKEQDELELIIAKTEKQKADLQEKARQDRIAKEIQAIETEKAMAAIRGEELFGYDYRLAQKRIELARLTKSGIEKAEADLQVLIAGFRQSEIKSLNDMLKEMEAARAESRRIEAEQAEAAAIAQMQAEASRRLKDAEDSKKFNEIRLADEKFLADSKYQIALGGFQAVADLVSAFSGQSEEAQERAFNVQKAASIAQTVIETITGASKAFNSLAGIPIVGVGLGIAAAGVATAAGLARIAAIKRTSFKSASSSVVSPVRPSGSGGQVNSTPPPSGFNPNTGTPTTGGNSGAGGQQMQGAQRVYVLERDITNTGRRVKAVENFATFGS